MIVASIEFVFDLDEHRLGRFDDVGGDMTMLKRSFAACALAAATVFAPVPSAVATVLPLGGPWVVLDQYMKSGDYFTGSWEINCTAATCNFWITDLFVASDRFSVYDNGHQIAMTPSVPTLAGADPHGFTLPWTDNPDVAFASGDFSHAVIALGAGVHHITIQDIQIPLDAFGAPFPDGTVAFQVTVPEPATLALLGLALVGLGFARRKRT